MTSTTLAQAITRFDVDVDEHLDRDVTIPILTGPQRQGDVMVLPVQRAAATTAVPKAGAPVVRGENGGNTHLLLADGPVCFDARPATADDLVLGVMTVADEATAYLAHPEHGYMGFGPGTYEFRRQREQADELRMVAD
jgi:hypothetical protein